MNVRSQISMVFHLDKCIGCHTCSVACKNLWTDRRGTEYMWWNNVETKPGTGYPSSWEDQEKYKGGWKKDGRRAEAPAGRPPGQPGADLLQPAAPGPRRLLRAVHLPVRRPLQRAGRERPAHRAPDLADRRQADGDQERPELGRRPLRLAGLRGEGPQPGRALRRGAGRAAGHRADGLLLPAAHLQPLPERRLRRRLPVGRHLQAGRGRHRAREPGPLPRLAHVRVGLPVQEDLLQLVHREVGEVHPLLPAPGDRPGAGLLPHLRGAHPLPGRAALRRRPARWRPPARPTPSWWRRSAR